MIAQLALCFCLAQAPQATQEDPTQKAGKIISAVFAHYHGLNSLVGTIKLVSKAKAQTGTAGEVVNTVLQFEKPNKFYLRQDRQGSRARTWIISSDGVHFSYNLPDDKILEKSDRLVEPVNTNDCIDIYRAGLLSIGDHSVPLGIGVNYVEDLRRDIAIWPEYELAGEVDYGKEKVWKIVGKYKDNAGGKILGDFSMLVSKANDLLEYSTIQLITPPLKRGQKIETVIEFTQTWTVNLHPNATPVEALFKVVI